MVKKYSLTVLDLFVSILWSCLILGKFAPASHTALRLKHVFHFNNGILFCTIVNLSAESFVERLDQTRIHPAEYEQARKLATDCIDKESDVLLVYGAVEYVMDNPELLEDLDLKKYNDFVMSIGGEDKLLTLEDIRTEMTHPFADLRLPYETLEREQLFYLLSKETPETLYPGKLVVAYVAGNFKLCYIYCTYSLFTYQLSY